MKTATHVYQQYLQQQAIITGTGSVFGSRVYDNCRLVEVPDVKTLKETFVTQLQIPETLAKQPNTGLLLDHLTKLFQETMSDSSKTNRFATLWEKAKASIKAGQIEQALLDELTIDQIKNW